ncbi:MAG: aspartate--tRNA(Asn) ligase [Candidatus Lokiarchaeota archaeon]|nr:aspartate--tRNA(Asn) ligase [Candidatus Lokiarchaeota archaeon]
MQLDKLGDWRKTHFTADLTPDLIGQTVNVAGWIKRIRNLGALRFIILQDCTGEIQITLKKGKIADSLFEKSEVPHQSSIGVTGVLKEFKQAKKGVEIAPTEIKVFNHAPEQLPLDMTEKTMSDLDTRLDHRALDLRLPRNLAIFRIQNQLLHSIRNVLNRNEFIEVITPKIIGTATEGGTELFKFKYFDKDAYLSQSAQLYKEQLTIPFERVFELASCYRAEKSFTNRHICEIYTLDIEMAFVTMEDIFKLMEEILTVTLRDIKNRCLEDLEILGIQESFNVPRKPFKKRTYSDIVKLVNNKTDMNIEWGEDISTEAYRKLDEFLPGYYWITHWPTKAKPFYIRPSEEDPKISESFDLQKGWLELASGGTRVHEKSLLIKRLKEQGLDPSSFESHLQTFDYGMPPHAGIGFGIGRFLTSITGVDQIKETVLYPRTPDRLTP